MPFIPVCVRVTLLAVNGFLPMICGAVKQRPEAPNWKRQELSLLKQPSPSPSNSVMTSVWNGAYQMINRANLVIAKAPDVTDDVALRDVTGG